MMIIKRVHGGLADSNSYLVGDGSKAVIIDVGVEKDNIFRMVSESGMIPIYVLLTHYHYDHILSLNEVRDRFGISAAIHRYDAPVVTDDERNGARLFGGSGGIHPVENLLEDGQILKVGSIDYKIIHTPGHTPGGICILTENAIFTGDTLFKRLIGRTDLGDGDYQILIDSINNRIMPLRDEVLIYPGHGEHSTVGDERRRNPFLAEGRGIPRP